MKLILSFLLLFEIFLCFSQDPTITFGGLKDHVVNKKELLLNTGIIFSNDTTENIKCLMAVDFSFNIIKLSGDTLVIKTNNCSDEVNKRKEEKMMKSLEKGKFRNYHYRRTKCQGLNRFNSEQLKAIKNMKSGESILIETVLTRASNCSCIGRWWHAGLKYTIK